MTQKAEKNTADVFVECLEAHGVTHVFGVPGEENLAFLEALRKSETNSKIKFVVTRDERGASFMAATFGRLTGKVGVALSTLGPGATNLLTGAAYATLGGFPMLLITGQKPIKKSKQGEFQKVDMVAMMKPVTKFSQVIASPKKISMQVQEAIRHAESERPGAVHLELPEDIADETSTARPILIEKTAYEIPSKGSINKILKEIEKAKRPVLILGRGANKESIRQSLGAFIEKTKIPFVSTQMGKGSVDEGNTLYVGTTAMSGGEHVHEALRHADAIVVVGHDVTEKPPIILTKNNFPQAKVVHVNYLSSSSPNVYTPTHEILGDVAQTFRILTEKIQINPSWDFSYFLKAREVFMSDNEKQRTSLDFPLRPEKIVADLQKVLPKGGVLALDNGMYKLHIARNFISRNIHNVLLDNTLASMGAGLPSGIALKILHPEKKVVVVTGDGGIMMTIAELETAARFKIDLVVLILDDSGYGMIRWKQKEMNLPSFGLSFSNPDFVILAKSFGASGCKVEKAEDLEKTLTNAINAKGVHLIVCPIDYEKANESLKLKLG